MDHALAIDHRIAVRRERPPQGEIRIELAVLVEVNDAQVLGALDLAGCGAISPRSSRSSVVLPLPFAPTKPNAHAGGDGESRDLEQHPAVEPVRDLFQMDQALGLPVRGGKIDIRGVRCGFGT